MQIVQQIYDVCIDGHFVLPLEFGPHLPKLRVRAGGWDDVVHYVNVDIIQYNTVPVTCSSSHIIYWTNDKDTVWYVDSWYVTPPILTSGGGGLGSNIYQFGCNCSSLTYVSKYDAIFSWSNFHVRLDICKIVCAHCDRLWLFYQFQVPWFERSVKCRSKEWQFKLRHIPEQFVIHPYLKWPILK